MKKQHRTFLIRSILIFLNILLIGTSVWAQSPAVKLEISPNKRVISIKKDAENLIVDPEDIAITARTDPGLRIEWNLDGPGKLDGNKTDPVIFYVPPNEILGESVETTIILTITDSQGKVSTRREKFTIIQTSIPPQPPFAIRQVLLMDAEGTIMNPTYFVEAGETVTITTDTTKSPDPEIEIECSAARGRVEFDQPKITYTALNRPGSRDMITIRAADKEGTVVQTIIKIQVKN